MTYDEYDKQFFEDDICIYCEGLAMVYYEPRYHGYKARCPDCDTTWNVS